MLPPLRSVIVWGIVDQLPDIVQTERAFGAFLEPGQNALGMVAVEAGQVYFLVSALDVHETDLAVERSSSMRTFVESGQLVGL